MLRTLRSLTVVVVLLAAVAAHAEECAISSTPACGGTCSAGFVCVTGQGGTACECAAGTPLAVQKLAVKLAFAKLSGDSILLKATVPVADGFVVAGRMVAVDVGGVVRVFILDAKGNARSEGAALKLAVKSKKGHVAAQDALVKFKSTKGTFADDLAAEGLANVTIDTELAIHVAISVDAALYAKTQTVEYKATQGKTGKAKNPR